MSQYPYPCKCCTGVEASEQTTKTKECIAQLAVMSQTHREKNTYTHGSQKNQKDGQPELTRQHSHCIDHCSQSN